MHQIKQTNILLTQKTFYTMTAAIIAVAAAALAAAAINGINKNGKFSNSKKNFTVDIDSLILEQ